jgi:hypothetical protein
MILPSSSSHDDTNINLENTTKEKETSIHRPIRGVHVDGAKFMGILRFSVIDTGPGISKVIL